MTNVVRQFVCFFGGIGILKIKNGFKHQSPRVRGRLNPLFASAAYRMTTQKEGNAMRGGGWGKFLEADGRTQSHQTYLGQRSKRQRNEPPHKNTRAQNRDATTEVVWGVSPKRLKEQNRTPHAQLPTHKKPPPEQEKSIVCL